MEHNQKDYEYETMLKKFQNLKTAGENKHNLEKVKIEQQLNKQQLAGLTIREMSNQHSQSTFGKTMSSGFGSNPGSPVKKQYSPGSPVSQSPWVTS